MVSVDFHIQFWGTPNILRGESILNQFQKVFYVPSQSHLAKRLPTPLLSLLEAGEGSVLSKGVSCWGLLSAFLWHNTQSPSLAQKTGWTVTAQGPEVSSKWRSPPQRCKTIAITHQSLRGDSFQLPIFQRHSPHYQEKADQLTQPRSIACCSDLIGLGP